MVGSLKETCLNWYHITRKIFVLTQSKIIKRLFLLRA